MNNKELIMKTAMKEFSKYGYEKTSVNSVLKIAKLSKGTFYHYFESKEILYMCILESFADRKKEIMQSVLSENLNIEKMDFFDILDYMTLKSVELLESDPVIFRFSISFLKEKGNEIFDKAMNNFNSLKEDMTKDFFNYFYGKKNFRKDIPKEFLFNYFQLIINGILEFTIANVESTNADNLKLYIKSILNIMKNGMVERER